MDVVRTLGIGFVFGTGLFLILLGIDVIAFIPNGICVGPFTFASTGFEYVAGSHYPGRNM